MDGVFGEFVVFDVLRVIDITLCVVLTGMLLVYYTRPRNMPVYLRQKLVVASWFFFIVGAAYTDVIRLADQPDPRLILRLIGSAIGCYAMGHALRQDAKGEPRTSPTLLHKTTPPREPLVAPVELDIDLLGATEVELREAREHIIRRRGEAH